MVRENPDPYLILGVSPAATQAEITHAYRSRLRAHHPDTRRSLSSQTADDRLRQVLAAYALLRDPARRADYDRTTAGAAHMRPRSPAVPTPPDPPSAGGFRSRSPTATTTPLQPLSHRHRCGPARCAATASGDRAEHLGAHPNHVDPYRTE
jgi:curved DNA-binding protein CbpA